MKKREQQEAVPFQYRGNKLDVEHSVFAPSIKEAMVLFSESVRRMLDVNRWQEITNSVLSTFKVTDPEGNEVDRNADENDYFKIEIPGPSFPNGDGYDWVRVELIKTKPNRVTLRVRPAESPLSLKAETAHFFTREATSTFQVFRRGRIVTAGVYGRNETPNTTTSSIVDKVRNATVAIGAIVIASRIQWESLVRGILGAKNNN